MSYRPSSYELWRRAVTVDKILMGAQSPPTFRSSADQIELVANPKRRRSSA